MITRVRVVNFKQFQNEVFDLRGNVVLVGPNNSGKTTLLQAIAVWQLVIRRWLAEWDGETPGQMRANIELPRIALTSVALRTMSQLWKDGATENDELKNNIVVEVDGEHNGSAFQISVHVSHAYQELATARVHTDSDDSLLIQAFENFNILAVPAFSGIGISEPKYDSAYQEMMIGQGKPGEILRNRMLQVAQDNKPAWRELSAVMFTLFGVTMLEPELNGYPYILCEYVNGTLAPGTKPKPEQRLDIGTAGSGFLQVLLILSFFYSEKSSVVLFDEPDAHLHIMLQKQMYDELRRLAGKSKSQLIVATHSEVIVDSTSTEDVLSFYGKPHRLAADREGEQVRLALRELSSMDLLLADRWPCILYLEGKSDFNLLREWARVLNHPLAQHFSEDNRNLFWHNNIGRQPKSAKSHLFALQSVKPEMKGILLLDGDDRKLPLHEVKQDGLEVITWVRYEAENYLLHPAVLERYVRRPLLAGEMEQFLQETSFPKSLKSPFKDDEIQISIGASKSFLPEFMKRFNFPVSKSEYYTIAAMMKPEEIHPEVKEKLDFIYESLVGLLPS